MVRRRHFIIALATCVLSAVGVNAQTTTGGAGTTGGATAGTGGGNTVSSSSGGGTASRPGTGTTGTGTTFAGTVPAGFSGGGTTTATNAGTGVGGVGGVGGAATTVPTTNNPWKTTYGNPYAIGQSLMGNSSSKTGGATATKGFGLPLFTTSTTAIGAAAGLQNNTSNASGFNNSNLSKVPRYTSALSEDLPLAAHPPELLQPQLQAILARSTAFKNNSQVRVYVDGDTVRLVGQVGSERERRLAESMLRLTPGVSAYGIENRLSLLGQP